MQLVLVIRVWRSAGVADERLQGANGSRAREVKPLRLGLGRCQADQQPDLRPVDGAAPKRVRIVGSSSRRRTTVARLCSSRPDIPSRSRA